MAKKKVQAKPVDVPVKKTRGRPKSPDAKGRTPIVMTVRGGKEWEEWIDRACVSVKERTGLGTVDRTDVVDIALADLATRYGLPVPPSRY